MGQPRESDPERADVAAGEARGLRVGEALKYLRGRLDLPQDVVASRAGISRNHYQLLEAGLGAARKPANPRLSTLVALAGALEVPPAELIALILDET